MLVCGNGLPISSGLCKRSLCFGLVYRNCNAPASSNTSWLAANVLKGNFGGNLCSFISVLHTYYDNNTSECVYFYCLQG